MQIKMYEALKLNHNEASKPTFDVLKWWFSNKETLPDLCLLVKQFLCIPATSTPSERSFSIAGNICTKNRNRLLPENVNMLCFLRNNLKHIPTDTEVLDLELNNDTCESDNISESASDSDFDSSDDE